MAQGEIVPFCRCRLPPQICPRGHAPYHRLVSISTVANAAMQPWLDDAQRYPRSIPAALRTMLAAGFSREDDALYFTALRREVTADLATRFAIVADRESFINTIPLGGLKPTKRLDDTTPEWAYECVAIGIALGTAVLEQHDVVVTVSLAFGEDVEYPSSTFRFTSADWAGELDDYEQAALVMRRD